MSKEDENEGPFSELKEGQDFYIENGNYVFTAYFLKKRGYCCSSGCRHCPYQVDAKEDIEARSIYDRLRGLFFK